MDFIKYLSLLDRFTNILMIIDCLTKQEVFILIYNTFNTPVLVELFIKQVFSKHGAPSYITSD